MMKKILMTIAIMSAPAFADPSGIHHVKGWRHLSPAEVTVDPCGQQFVEQIQPAIDKVNALKIDESNLHIGANFNYSIPRVAVSPDGSTWTFRSPEATSNGVTTVTS